MTIRKFILEVADDGSERVKSEIEKLEREWGIEEIEAQSTEMRDATEEERKSVKDYIESISKPTGIHFYEEQPTEECEENGSPWCLGHCPYNTDAQPTDAVSREEALLALTGMDLPTDRDKLIALFTNRIQYLPSVTPRTNLAETSQDCISILNRIMEYTYGMLTTEKIGLQHLIKSMMDELSGGDSE